MIQFEGSGFEIAGSTPAEFADAISKHTAIHRRLTDKAGIKAE